MPTPHRTFQLFPERGREQMTGLWRPVRHRAIMRQLSYITQKHGFYSPILRLCTHTLFPLSHLFCSVLIIIWWFWIKRSQLLSDLPATMTQITLIWLEKYFLIFKTVFFVCVCAYVLSLECENPGRPTDASHGHRVEAVKLQAAVRLSPDVHVTWRSHPEVFPGGTVHAVSAVWILTPWSTLVLRLSLLK